MRRVAREEGGCLALVYVYTLVYTVVLVVEYIIYIVAAPAALARSCCCVPLVTQIAVELASRTTHNDTYINLHAMELHGAHCRPHLCAPQL